MNEKSLNVTTNELVPKAEGLGPENQKREIKPRPGRQLSLDGQRFGKLVVVGSSWIANDESYHICQCDCGRQCIVRASSLKRGTKSCRCPKLSDYHKHGLSKHPCYRRWYNMMGRCHDKLAAGFENYGARGIRVCERWHAVENFIADMGIPPSKKHQLDRIDNAGNYEPGNVRWVTAKENCRNTRVNRWMEHDGRRMTITDWAKELGFKSDCAIRDRLRDGWPLSRALTQKARSVVVCVVLLFCIYSEAVAPRTEKQGSDLMRLARGTNLVDAARALATRLRSNITTAASTVPLPTNAPTTRAVTKAALPVPATRVWSWDVPAWKAYDVFQSGTNLHPATWLERVTALGATNWTQCSSNVPITALTHSVSAVVTNLPVYFLRSVYGWRKME